MPIYRIQDTEGNVYEHQGPPGLSRDQVIAAITQKQSAQVGDEEEFDLQASNELLAELQRQRRIDNMGMFENFRKGIGAGVVGLGESAALGAITPFGEETEAKLREGIQSVAQRLRPEYNAESLAGKGGQAVGSVAGALPLAAIPGVGAPIAAAGLFGAAGVGEASERARAAGASEEERGGAALRGLPIGLIDVLPLGRLAKAFRLPLPKGFEEALTPKRSDNIKQWLWERTKTGGIEGAQEAFSELLQNVNEQVYNAEQTYGEGLGEAGGLGAFAGAAIDAIIPGRMKGALPSEKEKKEAEEARKKAIDAAFARGPQGELFPETLGKAPKKGTVKVTVPFKEAKAKMAELQKQGYSAVTSKRVGDNAEIIARGRFDDDQTAPIPTAPTPPSDGRLSDEEVARRMAEAGSDEKVAENPSAPVQGDFFADFDRSIVEGVDPRLTNDQLLLELLEGEKDQSFDPAVFENVDRLQQEGAERQSLIQQAQRALASQNQQEVAQAQELLRILQEEDAAAKRPAQDAAAQRRAEQATQRQSQREYGDLFPQAEGMGPPAPPPAERREASPEQPPVAEGQMDIDELIRLSEEQELVEMQRQEDAQRAERDEEGLRQNIQEIDARRDYEREQTSQQNRQAVIDDVLANSRDLGSLTVEQAKARAETALAEQNFGRPVLSPAETSRVKRALDLGRAKPGVRAEVGQVDDIFGTADPSQPNVPTPPAEAPATQEPNKAQTEMFWVPKEGQKVQNRKYGVSPFVQNMEKRAARQQAKAQEVAQQAPEASDAPVTPAVTPAEPAGKGSTASPEVDRPSSAEPTAAAPGAVTGKPAVPSPNRVGAAGSGVASTADRAAGTESTLSPKEAAIKEVQDAAAAFSAAQGTNKEAAARDAVVKARRNLQKIERQESAANANRAPKAKPKAKPKAAPKTDTKTKVADAAPKTDAKPKANVVDKEADVDAENERQVQELYERIEQLRAAKKPDIVADTATPKADKAAVDKLRLKQEPSKEEEAAYTRFTEVVDGKQVPINVAIDTLAADALSNPKSPSVQSAVRWVRDNLTAGTAARLDAKIGKDTAKQKTPKVVDEEGEEVSEGYGYEEDGEAELDDEAAAFLREHGLSLDGDAEYFTTATAAALDTPAHPRVRMFVKANNLKSALQTIAENTDDPAVAAMARKIAENTADTKIELVPADQIGGLQGLYDPKTNTIKIATEADMTNHLVMHEAAHAATLAVLKNKSHPTTKQLQRIYEDVQKRGLDGDVGKLEEFVAEFFSNPLLRNQLATMYPNKSDLSLFDRMLKTISDYLRKLFKMAPSKNVTMEQLTQLMEEVISPSAKLANVPKYAFSPMKMVESLDKTLQAKIKRDTTTDVVYKNVREVFKRASAKSVDAGLGMLTLPNLVTLAEKHMPKTAMKFLKAINTYTSDNHAVNDALGNGVIRDFRQWWAKNPGNVEDMKEVLLEGTLAKIDFRNPLSHYEKLRRDIGAEKGVRNKAQQLEELQEKIDAYKRIKPALDRLKATEGGFDTYRAIRQTFDNIYKERIELIEREVRDGGGDKPMADKLKNMFVEQIKSRGGLEGYFPLFREGNYLLEYSYVDDNGNRRDAYEMFDNEIDRDRKAEEVEALAKANNIELMDLSSEVIDPVDSTGERPKRRADEVGKPIKKGIDINRNYPSTSFVGQVMSTLKNSKVDAKTQEMIMRLAIQASPNNSLISMLKTRKGTKGYDTDVLKVFEITAQRMAKQNVTLRHRARLTKISDEMEQEVTPKLKAGGEEGKAADMYWRELSKRLNLARDPFMHPAANWAKAFSYAWTLGLNPSSAIIDTAAIPMVLYPNLNGEYKGQNVMQAITDGMKLFANSGNVRVIESFETSGLSDADLKDPEKQKLHGYTERQYRTVDATFAPFGVKVFGGKSIMNFNMMDKDLPDDIKRYKELQDVIRENGQDQRLSYFDDSDSLGQSRLLGKINAYQGAMMQMSERFRREVTMVSAYNLELNKMKEDGRTVDSAARREAAEKAMHLSERLNGSGATMAGMRYSQTPIASVAFMYKRYSSQMMFHQARMLYDGYKNKDLTKQEYKIARAQFFQTFMMSSLFAGVRGAPLMGVIAAMWNMFMVDEDDDDWDTAMAKMANGALGVTGGTLFTEGILNTLFDMKVNERIAMTNMLFRSEPNNEDLPPVEAFVTELGGPFVGSISRFIRGYNIASEGHYMRGMEQMMPVAIGNVLKAGRFSTEGAQTLRGDVIMEDFGPLSLVGQLLGFSPAEYARKQSLVTLAKRKDREIKKTRASLYDRAWMARRIGDYEGFEQVWEEIEAFNDRVEDPKDKIERKDLESSAKIRESIQKIFGVTAGNPERWMKDIEELKLE